MEHVIPRLDHGAIGNGRVLALVAPNTRIEWLCLPRFDSPSVFASLLDPDRGGSFGVESVAVGARMEMAYVANTNVLRTRVSASDGVFDIFDYAPRLSVGVAVDAPPEIHRLLVPREGHAHVRIHFDPRPDYARVVPEIVEVAHGLDVVAPAVRLYLRSNVPAPYLLNGFSIRLDEPRFFILSCAKPTGIDSVPAVRRVLEETIAGWRAWAKTCALPSFAEHDVLRSALCLKLHAFEETGGIIAAATTSVPEAVGIQRTSSDSRYCWLRNSADVVDALRRLGHLAEGEAFVRFIGNVAEQGPLRPVYGVGGERDLPEQHLDHLAGGRPVRIGNGAHRQKLNDLMGEMVLLLETLCADVRVAVEDCGELFALVERSVEEAIEAAPTDDTGPWESQTRLRPYTFSKVLCWVAAHRGARLARLWGRGDRSDAWDHWAERQQAGILDAAWNRERGFFTQTLRGENPDASLLLMPTLGIIDARDPRFVSTVRAYERVLVEGGVMLRYRDPHDSGEATSAFSVCSFWWVEALAMMGELEKAVNLFNRLLTYANPLGLFSENIDPKTGRLLGNFPHAYAHVGLIHAAFTIGARLKVRDGGFRAWT